MQMVSSVEPGAVICQAMGIGIRDMTFTKRKMPIQSICANATRSLKITVIRCFVSPPMSNLLLFKPSKLWDIRFTVVMDVYRPAIINFTNQSTRRTETSVLSRVLFPIMWFPYNEQKTKLYASGPPIEEFQVHSIGVADDVARKQSWLLSCSEHLFGT